MSIEEKCEQLVAEARRRQGTVRGVYDGVEIAALPEDTPARLVEHWRKMSATSNLRSLPPQPVDDMTCPNCEAKVTSGEMERYTSNRPAPAGFYGVWRYPLNTGHATFEPCGCIVEWEIRDGETVWKIGAKEPRGIFRAVI